jgi:transposase
MTGRKNKIYSSEFKIEAIKLVLEQGYTQAGAARNLGIEASLLGKWIRAYKSENCSPAAFPGKGHQKPADAEIAELKKKLNKITRERDILKKAMGYFASHPE